MERLRAKETSLGERSHTPKGRARREEILDAAVTEFTARGYRHASIAAIAQRAGITKGGLVHHFPTKEDLLSAVLLERSAQQRVAQQAAGIGDDLGDTARYIVRANQKDLRWARFLTIMVAESLTEDHPAFETIAARYRLTQKEMTQRLVEERDYAPEDAAVTAAMFTALLDGLQIQALLDPAFEMTVVFDRFLELVRSEPR
jgi:Transcriptional regulator